MTIAGDFRSYDYGNLDNDERFERTTSMKYNLKRITAPLALFYGNGDPFATKTVSFL